MRSVGSIMLACGAFCGALFGAAGCATRPPNGAASAAPAATALPSVAAQPDSALPDWIASVSPRGEAADGAQIRIRFSRDLVPIEALESSDRAGVLGHFSIAPPLPGRFVILTPRMIGFAADAQIPHGTRVRVTASAGLRDLAGDALASSVAWSFTTKPVTLSLDVPAPGAATAPPVGRTPTLTVDASDPLDSASLEEHAHLVDTADPKNGVALQLAPSPAPDATETAGSTAGARYRLVPIANLAPATSYALTIDAGVASAAGNVATTTAYRGELHTYGALALTGAAMSGEPGKRFANGEPLVTFTNPVTLASALKAITLTPAPNRSLPLLRVDDGGIVTIDADALAPRTTYHVAIARTLADTFGQTLDSEPATSFTTGDLAATVWAPAGLRIFPAGENLALDVTTTNLPEGGYRAAFRPLRPRDLVAHDPADDDDLAKLLPPVDAWPMHAFGQPLNESVQAALPLRTLAGGPTGMLAYGVTARLTRAMRVSEAPHFTGAVLVTDIGVFAQWFPGGGLVRAQRLSDGSPLGRARVELYEVQAGYGAAAPAPDESPCAAGTTGADGTWRIASAAFGPCAGTAPRDGQAPALMAVVRAGLDWAYVRTRPYASGYANGLDNEGWSAGAPTALGSIVSDRALYQPGEDARFLGVAYFERNGVVGRGTSASYDVSAISPSGTKRSLGTYAPDAFGAFALAVHVPANAEAGDWTLEARGAAGEVLGGGYRVAEFKPPDFKTDLTLGSDAVTMGASVPARTVSAYLFGAPVTSGTAHVAVTRAPAAPAPAGYAAYTFGRQWPYPEEMPNVPSDVLQRDIPLDARGEAALDVPVATDLPYPMQYTVVSSTTDVSNLSVSDTKTFRALPGDVVIGLRSDFLATAGTPFEVSAVALDAHDAPQAGRRLHVVIAKRIYDRATQIQEGGESERETVRYDDVAAQDVDSAAKPATLRFTLHDAGEYRVRANVAGAAGDATATDAQLWVAGAGEAAWFSGGDDALPVKLDKTTYRPGERATALVESPFADADLYFSVVRHGVLFERHERVHGAAPEVGFTVTPGMLPNAAVEALLVRRGPPLREGATAKLAHLSRLGFAPFDVALDTKYLRVAVRAAHASLEPAAEQRVTLHLSGSDGKPVLGEAAIAVVNDAILQLDGYRLPDFVKQVYAAQPISTRFADDRDDVVLESPREPLEKGFGFGGGELAGAATTRVRRKFVPLAYWNAAVRTDAAGDASVSFALPDDLTTWRVMALALGRDARFGNGETTFVTTKPLVTDPVLPQFVRPGDAFDAGVAVTATASVHGTLALTAAVAGGATFATGDPHTAATSAPLAATTQAYRFRTLAGSQTARFTFRSQAADATDAFAFSVPVIAHDVLESVVTTGTTQTASTVPIDVAPGLQGRLGALDVTLASTLLGDVTAPVAALTEPAAPLGTDLAACIAIASDAIVLNEKYGRPTALPMLRKNVVANLALLRVLALPDGGFADWPGAERSEPYGTAFVVEQLDRARHAGFDVAADLAHGKAFLTKVIADPAPSAGCGERDAACRAAARLEALETLGTLGDPRDQFVADILASEGSLSYYERVELARFLLRLVAWHGHGIALRDKLFEQLHLSARHATLDARGSFGESETAGRAQVLLLGLASAMPADDIDHMLTSLLDLRTHGDWGCACDDAEAMNALVAYAAHGSPTPNFSAEATLPASPPKIVHARFHGFSKTLALASLPIDEVSRGPAHVALAKHGSGTLHYSVRLTYRAADTAPGIYAGLRVERILRAVGDRTPLATLGLSLPGAPAEVAAGHVFDIEDRLVTDHPIENLLITDPLPAGFEAVDQSFRTAAPADLEDSDTIAVDYQSIYKDRVVSFVRHLDAGSYALHFLARSVTPGKYAWPGVRAELEYYPEEFGRSAATSLRVDP